MDKFLTASSGADTSRKRRRLPAGTGQLTLHQCKKTVMLRGHTAMNFTNDDLLACKSVLEDASSACQKLEQLRKLSVMHVSKAHLVESQVAGAVRKLTKSDNAEVARLAQRVVDKWKAQVLKQHSPSKRISKATKTMSSMEKPNCDQDCSEGSETTQ